MPIDRFPEDELVPAEHALKHLHTRRQAQPSTEFVMELEHTLFNPAKQTPAIQSTKRVTGKGFRTPLLPERIRRRHHPLWAAGALGLAVLLITASLVVSGISRKSSPPTRTAPIVASSLDSSPAPETYGILWTLPAPSGTVVGSGSMALGGNTLYRATSSSVQAISTDTGIPIWETRDLTPRAVVADKNGVFVSTADSEGDPVLMGLDSRSGSQIWSIPLPYPSENLLVQSGIVFAQDWANHVLAVSAESGEVIWQQSIGPDSPSSETAQVQIVATGKTLFTVSTNRVITAFDLQTGAVAWDNEGVIASEMALSGDTLGIIETAPPDYGRVLVAYDAIDGSQLWQRTLDNPDSTNPGTKIVGGSTWFAFISSDLGELTPLNASFATPTGDIPSWATDSSAAIFSEPPTFPVIFKVDVRSGLLSQVSKWTENPDPRTNDEVRSLNSPAITLAISDVNPLGILVLSQNGRVGWIGDEGATGEKIDNVPARAFTGGDAIFPYELPEISFNVVLADNNAAYIAMRDGSLIAIEARQLPDGPPG